MLLADTEVRCRVALSPLMKAPANSPDPQAGAARITLLQSRA
jgi:hypothetical protein